MTVITMQGSNYSGIGAEHLSKPRDRVNLKTDFYT